MEGIVEGREGKDPFIGFQSDSTLDVVCFLKGDSKGWRIGVGEVEEEEDARESRDEDRFSVIFILASMYFSEWSTKEKERVDFLVFSNGFFSHFSPRFRLFLVSAPPPLPSDSN